MQDLLYICRVNLQLTYNLLTMKKLFAILMAFGLVGFIACSSPATEGEAESADESAAVMDEMEDGMEAEDDAEMAEDASAEAEEGGEEATDEGSDEEGSDDTDGAEGEVTE